MWDAQDNHFNATGRPPTGVPVYEVAVELEGGGQISAQDAIESWKNSHDHWVVISGVGDWRKNDHFGCGIFKKFASCYFQEKLKVKR